MALEWLLSKEVETVNDQSEIISEFSYTYIAGVDENDRGKIIVEFRRQFSGEEYLKSLEHSNVKPSINDQTIFNVGASCSKWPDELPLNDEPECVNIVQNIDASYSTEPEELLRNNELKYNVQDIDASCSTRPDELTYNVDDSHYSIEPSNEKNLDELHLVCKSPTHIIAPANIKTILKSSAHKKSSKRKRVTFADSATSPKEKRKRSSELENDLVEEQICTENITSCYETETNNQSLSIDDEIQLEDSEQDSEEEFDYASWEKEFIKQLFNSKILKTKKKYQKNALGERDPVPPIRFIEKELQPFERNCKDPDFFKSKLPDITSYWIQSNIKEEVKAHEKRFTSCHIEDYDADRKAFIFSADGESSDPSKKRDTNEDMNYALFLSLDEEILQNSIDERLKELINQLKSQDMVRMEGRRNIYKKYKLGHWKRKQEEQKRKTELQNSQSNAMYTVD